MKFSSFDIVFQEVPGEVTLAVNISNCPHRCKGCHSAHLQQNIGEVLDEKCLDGLLARYGNAVTCVCFMGGDADPTAVERLSAYVRETTNKRIKTAWYSGCDKFPENCSVENFDYLKIGPYIESLGGLDSPTTNQRFYKVENGILHELTFKNP